MIKLFYTERKTDLCMCNVQSRCKIKIFIRFLFLFSDLFGQMYFRTFKSRDKELLMTLFKSLLRSRLEYCSPLWSHYLQKDIIKMESVQRMPDLAPNADALKQLGLHILTPSSLTYSAHLVLPSSTSSLERSN